MWNSSKAQARQQAKQRSALEDHLANRSRTICGAFDRMAAGEAGLSPRDIQVQFFEFFAEAIPALPDSGTAALALLDATPRSLQIALAVEDWEATAQVGSLLAATVMALRKAAGDLDVVFERELGQFVGAHLEVYLYALARLGRVCDVGANCDILLGGGFARRQFVQTADVKTRQAWDLATGVLANGGLGLSEEEFRAKLAAGAWLTERQRVDISLDQAGEAMSAWLAASIAILGTVPPLPIDPGAAGEGVSWSEMVQTTRRAKALAPEFQVAFSSAAGCATPLAALKSHRDLVYLIAGMNDGVAVRYFGGEEYQRRPEAVDLPGAGLQVLRGLAADLEGVGGLPASDLRGRSEIVDRVRSAVGRLVLAPVHARWPDRRRVTFIAVGEIAPLPISSALVDGRRLGSLMDVTVAPNASTLLVAVAARRTAMHDQVRVMADPADGEIRLPWVVEEAERVAAVYGRRPDLVVDYGQAKHPRVLAARSALAAAPAVNVTSEHVLTKLEDAGTIHLACHGYVPEDEGLPGLLLHGRLTFDALDHHRLSDGATVVLSACSVARSIRTARFAQLGFPAMLLSTGASQVVASTQPMLDSPETVDLMVSLHRHLREGTGAALALERAIADSEREDVPSAVWGSLEVFGAPPLARGNRWSGVEKYDR